MIDHGIEEKKKAFEKLLNIMDELRSKCPWDSIQTKESIRNLTIEEVYELADAVLENNYKKIKEELGDVMLHLVFYARMAAEENQFDMKDVLDAINAKLILRHPHVFGEVKVNDETEVKENWEQIKLSEGNRSVLAGVPVSLPALVKASRIQEKVRAVGFDWEDRKQVWDKINEELAELQTEVEKGDRKKIEEEFGDLLFSVVNAARLYHVDPETALERTNKKFIRRFLYVEQKVRETGKSLKQSSLQEMDKFWNEAKQQE